MAQHVMCTWRGLEAIHRFEDLALIAEVLAERRPLHVVELGTAGGGFAAFLADTVRSWGGTVLTVDHKVHPPAVHGVLEACGVERLLADCLVRPHPKIVERLARQRACLYTDNGNKTREIELYAPGLGAEGTLGTHDYGTELAAGWAETFLAGHRFAKYRHDDFAALAHPQDYPDSLTRFWTRDAVPPRRRHDG